VRYLDKPSSQLKEGSKLDADQGATLDADSHVAFEAVALLRKRGYTVRRLEDGFPEWKAAGLPVV